MNDWKTPISYNQVLRECRGNHFATTVMILLLLRCSNKERDVLINGKTYYFERGECLAGRNELAQKTGSSPQRIRSIVNFLEKSTKQITKRKTLGGSIIKLLNYDMLISLTNPTTNHQPIANQLNNHKQERYNKNDIKTDKREDDMFVKYKKEYKNYFRYKKN